MSPPWEVVMKFQEQLRPAAAGNDAYKQHPSLTHLSGAAQKFVPSNSCNGFASRVQKVKNLVNESAKVIDESRPPEFNSTVASFCQNCSCDNCANQSMLLGNDTQLNNTTVNAVIQSFEKFLEMQKQQFMMALQQALSGMNMSYSGVDFQHMASNAVMSTSSGNQLAITNCGSSEIQNDGSQPSDSITVTSCVSSPCRSIMATIDPQKDKCTSSVEKKKKTSKRDKSTDEFNFKKPQENDELSNVSGLESFDGFLNENFKSIRKSSLIKLHECSVVLKRSEDNDSELNKSKSYSGAQPNKNLTPSEKEKLLGDLTFIFQDEFPSESNNKANNLDAKSTLTIATSRTRSGRTVQKPGEYWSSNSRHPEKEVQPMALPQEVPSKRKGVRRGELLSKAQSQALKGTLVSLSSDTEVEDAELLSETSSTRGRKKKSPVDSSVSADVAKSDITSTLVKLPAKKRKMEEPSKMRRKRQVVAPGIKSQPGLKRVPQGRSSKKKDDLQNQVSCSSIAIYDSHEKPSSTNVVESGRIRPQIESAKMPLRGNVKKVNDSVNLKQSSGKQKPVWEPASSKENSQVQRKMRQQTKCNMTQKQTDISLMNTTEPDFVCYFEGDELSDLNGSCF